VQGLSTFPGSWDVAKLINKQSVRDPPTVKLLWCNNCCTCTEQN